MSDLQRFLYSIVGSIGMALITLAMGYLWAKAMHYPLTLRQRKMLTYYALFVCSFPILGPSYVAMARWVMPINQSGIVTLSLLLGWMVIAFFIVRRMSKPGGRLSEERR
jgi:hypothetical protein